MVRIKKEKNYLSLGLLVLTFFIATNAFAARLNTSYMTATIPNTWTCVSKQAFWVCKDFSKKRQKSHMLTVITAKKNLPDESINKYRNSLQRPKTITDQNGKLIQSKVYSSKEIELSGQKWVQAMHYQSELKDYYTYYMFTKRDQLSVSISMNVHRNAVKRMNNDIGTFLNSIQLKDVKFKDTPKSGGSPFDMLTGNSNKPGSSKSSLTSPSTWSKKRMMSIAIIVLAVSIIGYAFIKK